MVFQVGFDAFDRVKLARVQVGVGDRAIEGLFDRRNEIGEGEGIEQTGVKERFVVGGRDGFAGDLVQDFSDFGSLVPSVFLMLWGIRCAL